MTGAGITVPPSRGPAPFARWSWLAASAVGCLAVAVVVATFPLGSDFAPAHSSLWTAEAGS